MSKKSYIFLEIGANSINYVKQFCKKHNNSTWQVHMFEANPFIKEEIKEQIKSSNIPNISSIKLYSVGVLDSNQKKNFI